MGGCVSCRSSSSFSNVRVVHLNGYVQDFDQPVSVGQVTGKPAEHFVCTPAQLLSAASRPSLKPDAFLEPGKIYLMLPYSTLRPDLSPMDLASISKKLTAAAKSNRCQAGKTRSPQASPMFDQGGGLGPSPIWNSPSRSPCRDWNSPARSPGRTAEADGTGSLMLYGAQRSPWSQPWKPILDTIKEKPFNQRSESDLQENHGVELSLSRRESHKIRDIRNVN